MTDRLRALVVTLDKNYRTDDAEHIVNAIRMIKGVAHVDTSNVVNISDHTARVAARMEIQTKLLSTLSSLWEDS